MEPIKDAFHRLLRFGRAKEHGLSIWESAVRQSKPALRWLLQWLRRRRRPVVVIIVGCVLLYLSLPYWPQVWNAYKADRDSFTPFFTPIGALLVGLAAFGQWRTARLRHEEQTNADRQRRLTESFSKAVEQLGSDKLEVRLGGIYSLERISKESPDDYWTVMENLTAFVRERSRRNEQRVERRAYFLWQEADRPEGRADDFWMAAAREEGLGEPAPDIVAVLAVIKRRSEQSRERERDPANDWRFNLSGAVLKQAILIDARLEGAILIDARLEGANLSGARLEGASLSGAWLEGANLSYAQLEGASLIDARLEGANLLGAWLEGANLSGARLERARLSNARLEGALLIDARLEGASLFGARLERASLGGARLEGAELSDAYVGGAYFGGARLEGADLSYAVGLLEAQLRDAYGDAETKLPEGLARPAHWLETGA